MSRRKLKLEELNRLSVEEFKSAPKRKLSIVLDNVRSMHNVGAILRTSDAFLVEKVYLCGITPKPPHREIRKTAIGAEESVSWEAAGDALAIIQKLQQGGYKILALEQSEGSIALADFEANPDGKYVIVLGHEVEGVHQEIVNLADQVLEVPQYGTKHSLNVSVAAGIVIYCVAEQLRWEHF